MAGSRLTKEQIRATLKAQAKSPGNHSAAARALGLNTATYKSRLLAVQRLGHKLKAAPKLTKGTVLTPQDVKAKQRAVDQTADLKKQVRDLTREINDQSDLRSFLFNLTREKPARPSWALRTKPTGSTPGMPILFSSDFQWGEVIQPAELDGLNEFNIKVARERYHRLIERSIDLAKHHMVNPKYDGIIYLRGGDNVSGDIHEELRETNDANSGLACKDLVAHEVEGIKELIGAFGKVHVISVPGNHGRTTEKPRAKKSAEENWDTVSAWWLESIFAAKDEKRVTFHTPLSGDALFTVYGHRYLLTHGDKIGSRGGEGFIGPAATIARGMKKTMDYYASIGEVLTAMFVGHFHTALELEHGWANGSLPGLSEYAKGMRVRVHRPSQWLLFDHPRHGITARWKVYLDDAREIATPMPDLART